MTREWKFFIQDIYDAIQNIKEFVGEMKQKEFLADEKTRSAVAALAIGLDSSAAY